MNDQETNLDLVRRCLDEEATAEEFADLESLLKDAPEFRKEYLNYLFVDSVLAGGIANFSEQLPKSNKSSSETLFPKKWNPLATAAAAGLIIGIFCASIGWAIIAPRNPGEHIVIPILSESFETAATPIVANFPVQAGVWGGDKSTISNIASGYLPAHGETMLRLETSPTSNLGFLQQIVDVSSLLQAGQGKMRYLETEASFLTLRSSERDRYTLRVATFEESPEEIRTLWENIPWWEIEKNTLTAVKSAISTQTHEDGWRTVTAAVHLPANANTVVISLATGRLSHDAVKIPHYVDDIHAEVAIIPLRKRKRRAVRQQ